MNFRKICVIHIEGKTFQVSSCVQGFWEILKFSQNERKSSQVTFISRGGSQLRTIHASRINFSSNEALHLNL